MSTPTGTLDADYQPEWPYRLAWIDESQCIGCTRCIQACPVDAIMGAAKLMHTVITAECIGCHQCLPPCPVDCIHLVESTEPWTHARADLAQSRYAARSHRLQQPVSVTAAMTDNREAAITAAVARSKAKKAAIAVASVLP